MKTAGIILAAGRGSRMKRLTAAQPKCMTQIAGKPLLHWQLAALRQAGVERILVVRGYAADCIQGDFETVENLRWEKTNMLSSLLCAEDFAQKTFAGGVEKIVVSYSDIVYHHDHVRNLLACGQNIAMTYDTQWESLWKLRCDDVLLDAESFRQEGGLLREIGAKPKSVEEIHGQYMGLLAFDAQGWQNAAEAAKSLGPVVDTTDMTSFLRLLLEQGHAIGAVPVSGKWCEVDNETDLRRYEEALAQGGWTHDWRG